jgi:antitoxin component YwqK of YwqJK toxin-antitoxin module
MASSFIDDKLNGERKRYYENGQLKAICFYIDGKLNGEQKWYYPNGQLREICTFIDGTKNGEYKQYYHEKWYDSNGSLY